MIVSSLVVVVGVGELVAVVVAMADDVALLILCSFDDDDDAHEAKLLEQLLARSDDELLLLVGDVIDMDIPSSSMAARCNKSLRTSMLLVEWWSGLGCC